MVTKNRITKQDYEQLLDESTAPPVLQASFADSKHIIIAGLLIVALFFGLGGAWVTLAEITGAVIAQGEVRVDSERKTVAHLEGGIIDEILVRNGDRVTKGQPLLVLESARVVASTEQVHLRLISAWMTQARLIAERDMLSAPTWPETSADVPQEKYDDLQLSESKVFSSNRKLLNSQTSLLSKQLDQLGVQIASIDDQLSSQAVVIATLEVDLANNLTLYDQKFIEKTQILQLERTLADRQSQVAQLKGNQAELREKVAEFRFRIARLKAEYRQKATKQLSEVKQTLNDLQQNLLPLEDARRRLEVTAPVSGEVVAMQVNSEDGVVKPGEPLLDIVPDDSPLIVESHIQVKDIASIHQGQRADVQLLAFSVRTTPKIHARVVYISADRLLKQTPYGEQPTYLVHVELDKKQLLENNLYLTAGMPAAVYINTEPRTVLDYILEPMVLNFDRALREN